MFVPVHVLLAVSPAPAPTVAQTAVPGAPAVVQMYIFPVTSTTVSPTAYVPEDGIAPFTPPAKRTAVVLPARTV